MKEEQDEWTWRFIEKNHSTRVNAFKQACIANGGVVRVGVWGAGNFSCHKGEDVVEFEPLMSIIRKRVTGHDVFYRPEEGTLFKRLKIDKTGFTMVEDVCVKKEEREEHVPFF